MPVLSARLASSPMGGRVGSALFAAAGLVHNGVAEGLRFVGRGLGAALAVLPWPVRLAILSAVLGGVALVLGYWGENWLIGLAELTKPQLGILFARGLLRSFRFLSDACVYLGWGLVAAAALALVRRTFALVILQCGSALFAAAWLWLLVLLVRVPAVLYHAVPKSFGKTMRNELWVGGVWAWVCVALLAALFSLCLLLLRVRRCYTGRAPRGPLLGDRVLDDLNCRGRDPGYRASTYWSTFAHLAFFFGPLLLRSCGMEEPYGIPKGSGVEVIETIKVKRVKRKKKERLILNMNSPIVFHVPKIEDSQLVKVLDDLTSDQYETTSLRKKLGKGGGATGGWPHGMENARVRFIRLKYRGTAWDHNMGFGGDYNLLLKLREVAGFRIAANTEAIEIHRLRRFPKHAAPPFVYITGRGSIPLSSAEQKTLRWYCLEEGGMLFADNAGGHFDRSFRHLLRRVFPELPLVDIASDDVIYQQPFPFPGGAPPLWHHAGRRALGVKHEGRWLVFYHPGDMCDAWKTGHSGASKAVANRAYKLGINVICYAFTQYLALHGGR
jgi:hypothetical protein